MGNGKYSTIHKDRKHELIQERALPRDYLEQQYVHKHTGEHRPLGPDLRRRAQESDLSSQRRHDSHDQSRPEQPSRRSRDYSPERPRRHEQPQYSSRHETSYRSSYNDRRRSRSRSPRHHRRHEEDRYDDRRHRSSNRSRRDRSSQRYRSRSRSLYDRRRQHAGRKRDRSESHSPERRRRRRSPSAGKRSEHRRTYDDRERRVDEPPRQRRASPLPPKRLDGPRENGRARTPPHTRPAPRMMQSLVVRPDEDLPVQQAVMQKRAPPTLRTPERPDKADVVRSAVEEVNVADESPQEVTEEASAGIAEAQLRASELSTAQSHDEQPAELEEVAQEADADLVIDQAVIESYLVDANIDADIEQLQAPTLLDDSANRGEYTDSLDATPAEETVFMEDNDDGGVPIDADDATALDDEDLADHDSEAEMQAAEAADAAMDDYLNATPKGSAPPAQALVPQLDDMPKVLEAIEETRRIEARRHHDAEEGRKIHSEHCRRMLRLEQEFDNPFGRPINSLLEWLSQLALDNANARGDVLLANPMNVILKLPGVEQGVSVADIITIQPEDTFECPCKDDWATDNLLDYLAGLARTTTSQRQSKHFVALPSDISRWIARDKWSDELRLAVDIDTPATIKELERMISEALPHVINPDPETEMYHFALPDMPADTRSVSIFYNVMKLHWAHVLLVVDEDRKVGKVYVHDSMGGGEQPKRRGRKKLTNNTLKTIQEELPTFLQLVNLRPSLGWQDVKWARAVMCPSPQQANSSDCGFYTWYCAVECAMGRQIDDPWAMTMNKKEFGKDLRWTALQRLHRDGMPINNMLPETRPGRLGAAPVTLAASNDEPTGRPRLDSASASVQESANGRSMSPAKSASSAPRLSAGRDRSPAKSPQRKPKPIRLSDIMPDYTGDDDREMDTRSHRARICDYMIEQQGRAMTVAEICDGVRDSFVDALRAVPLEIRVESLLDNTPSTFVCIWDEEDATGENEVADIRYRLRPGPGHTVDTRSQEYLLKTAVQDYVLPDDIEEDFDLYIPCARYSEGKRSSEEFDRLEDSAQKLMEAHHYRFHPTSTMPKEITDAGELEEAIDDEDGCWFSNDMTSRSSTKRAFSQASDADVRAVLDTANDIATKRDVRVKVLLLMSFFNGLTTDNESWEWMIRTWPNIDFRLTMVMTESALLDTSHFRMDRDTSCSTGWASYKVEDLAWLYQSGRVTVDTIRELDPKGGYSSEDDDENNDDDRATLFFDLHRHAQFLQALTTINCLRIDESLFQKFSKASVYACNLEGTQLAGAARNSRNFVDLAREPLRVCDVKDCAAEDAELWVRGRSSSVAVRCADHGENNNEVEAFERQSPAKINGDYVKALRSMTFGTAKHQQQAADRIKLLELRGLQSENQWTLVCLAYNAYLASTGRKPIRRSSIMGKYRRAYTLACKYATQAASAIAPTLATPAASATASKKCGRCKRSEPMAVWSSVPRTRNCDSCRAFANAWYRAKQAKTKASLQVSESANVLQVSALQRSLGRASLVHKT